MRCRARWEMIEAVGANHWPDYFKAVERRLAPGGRFALQAITQEDRAVRAVGENYLDLEYIFPGGQGPWSSIAQTVRDHTTLRITEPKTALSKTTAIG